MTPHSFGKYVVTDRLGRGGMAEVYKARDPVLERSVAVKVIQPHLATEEGFAARFLREAKLVASLRHPHIVQIFDLDVFNDQPFMVMEFLAGETLKARLAALRARGERYSLSASVRLLTALAGALDYAHARGVVHRDFKPANILFTEQGEPVLTDFGIAKLLDQTAQLSMTGGIVGTPAYMSPEQAAGKPVDNRSDLYSLGVVAYELVTGRVPFQGDAPTAILMQHLLETPPEPRIFNPNLPPSVERVILHALAKDPAERYASAGAYAQALHTALHSGTTVDVSPESATVVEQRPAVPVSVTVYSDSDLPSWSTENQPIEWATTRSLFVAREQELDQLQVFLERALSGEGQVCFVTGEAGVGKTALVTEFARRAQAAYPGLIVAVANCNTQSGVGDPYLPFREALTRLLGLIGTEAPARAVAEHGPDLIDIFVPGAELMRQLEDLTAGSGDWIGRLQDLVQRKARAAGGEIGIEQGHIFEQYTNVLKALAVQQPLLLVVDDLQWVDVASADLLFHLSRRLGDSRILLLGTYRPDEVTLGRGGDPHPLEKVLAELKRYFGDIQVILGQDDEASRRRLMNALLDREPNRLDEPFRRALFRHTDGHALFIVELLRNMRARGDLIQDKTGFWVEGPLLEWGKLPPRVEGVIEERVGRLEDELREVLTIASVEGEDFTAEVVARVQEVDARGLIRQLGRELEQQHRLVRALGRQWVSHQRLSLFRFQHNLFQKYLYNSLNVVDRAYFHEDVGTVLEELYGENADEIAVQLAWHFSEADLPEKASHYLAVAGEQARRRYANAEALSYLNRALDLTSRSDHAARYTLLLARQKVYDMQGDRQAQHQDLAQLEELAQRLGEPQRQAEVALSQALYAARISEYTTSIMYAQTAIELAASVCDVAQEAEGYQRWGSALLNLSDYPQSRSKLERALALADAEQLHQVKANSLRALGVVAYFMGDFHGAAATYEQALDIYRMIGDQPGEGNALGNLGLSLREQGHYLDARRYFDQALQLYQEIGDRGGAAWVLNNLGLLCRDQGDHAASHTFYEQALKIARQTGARSVEGSALLGIGDVYKDLDRFTSAAPYYEQATAIYREIGDRRFEYLALKELANIALSLGDYATALTHLETALASFREIGDRQSECSTLNRLGLLYHQMGDEEAARTNSEAALAIAQEIGDRWLENSSLTKLGHALAGLGQPDAASHCYQQAAALWREQGRPDLALESVAGLARIALSQGQLRAALAYVEEIMAEFEDETFSNAGMSEEYLTCYRVLYASRDGRAAVILSTIYSQLQESAAKIEAEEMRRSYLEAVPVHREIVAAWRSHQGSNADDPANDRTIAT